MPREIRRCCAPRAFHPHLPCDKEFICEYPQQKYCSHTCRNRANKIARYAALMRRALAAGPATTRDILQQEIAKLREEPLLPRERSPSSEDVLRSLGYGTATSAATSAEPKRVEKPDKKAEPRELPKADENNPPDFRNYEEIGPVDPDEL
jgi:hypothetical protein